MSTFPDVLTREHRSILERLCPHPLAVQILAGDISPERFEHWLGQNFLWHDEMEKLLVRFVSRAPREIRRPLLEHLLSYSTAQGAYRILLQQEGYDPTQWTLDFAGHAYVSYLQSIACVGSLEEAAVCHYASHLAYFENWLAALKRVNGWGPRGRFLEQLGQPAYREWIEELANDVSALALAASAQMLDRMRESFRLSLLYQERWWNESLEGRTW